MFVAERMTRHPITMNSSATIGEVDRMMKKYKFHRMIIVDGGKLVGYLSDRDVMRVAPSPATSLSKFEIRTLLDKLSVKDIMQTKVITVSESATIEEAALIMYQNKVGGLPVISEVGTVVGIITATDILKTFIEVMGLPSGGKIRMTLEVPNRVGVMAEITKILADKKINIDSIIICHTDEQFSEIVVRLDDRPEGFGGITSELEAHGYKVIHVVKIK
ncbi:MAG: CBS domain-containing protein [Selenomonadaceae bacterium]|nr:CBS domain-containing protein [Selenomonadaceae bacterium]